MDLIKELENLSGNVSELYINSADDAWALDVTYNIICYIEKQQKRYEKKRNKKYTRFNTICHILGLDK